MLGKKSKIPKVLFKPRKELGQNFISDEVLLERIADSCLGNKKEKQKIAEIGPGYGALTRFLLKKAQKVYCFEKDENLFNFLVSHFSGFSNAKFFLVDALEIEWKDFFEKEYNEIGIFGKVSGVEKINLVGNLPYNISNKIIFNIFKQRDMFERMVFLVQKEVARRWTANPSFNKSDYSFLSIFLEYFSERETNFEVSKNSFYPIPKVDACLVTLKIREKVYFNCKKKESSFLKFVKSCFNFRRKSLLNNIKSFAGIEKEEISKVLKSLNFNSNSRPQDLWINDYLNLYNEISSKIKFN